MIASRLALAAALALVSAVARATDHEAVQVTLKIDGEPVALSDDVRDRLRDQADKIVRHCGYDAGDRETRVWLAALAAPSSIRLVYATPVEVKLPRRRILMSQAVFLVEDADFLGQPIVYHDDRATQVVKCDGGDMLVLMCMPELKAYFPPGYQGNCKLAPRQ